MMKDFYNLHAEFCKIISNPKRLEIIDSLRKGEMAVGALAEITGISQANLSQHLTVLRTSGVVRAERQGVTVRYSIVNPKIIQAFDLICEILQETSASENQTIHEALAVK